MHCVILSYTKLRTLVLKLSYALWVAVKRSRRICRPKSFSPASFRPKRSLLVPEKDPEALASAYKRLAAEPELVKHLLASAQKRIAECFTWDGIIERQIAVYNKVLK